MALLHDVVEIDAGDTIVYGDLSGKKEKEAAASERIFGLLPQSLGDEFKSVWEEFEVGESPEAKFVSAIDRFLPIFSNILNQGYSWKSHGITEQRIYGKCEEPISQGFPALWVRVQQMLKVAIDQGHLSR